MYNLSSSIIDGQNTTPSQRRGKGLQWNSQFWGRRNTICKWSSLPSLFFESSRECAGIHLPPPKSSKQIYTGVKVRPVFSVLFFCLVFWLIRLIWLLNKKALCKASLGKSTWYFAKWDVYSNMVYFQIPEYLFTKNMKICCSYGERIWAHIKHDRKVLSCHNFKQNLFAYLECNNSISFHSHGAS